MKMVRPFLQKWDRENAKRVHDFLANSKHVQERIARLYGRTSIVVYPPADVDFFSTHSRLKTREDFYLVVSALAPYKRLDLAIDACRAMNRRLVIIGEGQESASLRARAGEQTEFLGWCSRETMRDYFQRAQALLFPGEEDFGIVPVEAQAAGCPVIAYRKGGALETVHEGKTGLFFDTQTVDSLQAAMRESERHAWNRSDLEANAARFSRSTCLSAFHSIFSRAEILPMD